MQNRVWAAILLCVSVLVGLSGPEPLQASVFYEYDVIAKTGDQADDGTGTLVTLGTIGTGPSINDKGRVGFQAFTNTGNNGLFVGEASPSLLKPFALAFESSTRIIAPAVQINNSGEVVERLRVSGSPPSTFIRVYNGINSFTNIARAGGVFSPDFDSVSVFPSLNNNSQVVFNALPPPSLNSVLATKAFIGFNQIGNPSFVALRPMMADDGRIVVPSGSLTSPQSILLHNYNFGTSDTIASNSNWSVLGNAPGISDDGKIVVFYGIPTVSYIQSLCGDQPSSSPVTMGPPETCPDLGASTKGGIFASIETASGRRLVRITGRQTLGKSGIPNDVPELGWTVPASATGTPMAIQFDPMKYDPTSRVAVTNMVTENQIDSFVVSFLATPNQASRDNPALPGKPLLFSNQLGLWTVRVDAKQPLTPSSPGGTGPVNYYPTSPLPVVQIGDSIWTGSNQFTVAGASIGVNDQLALASTDKTGMPRTIHRGDHRVAFWVSDASGNTAIVRGTHLDSEQDGLLDHWETTGIDVDQDGSPDLNLKAMGADPTKRDIFLEIDWLQNSGRRSFQPHRLLLDRLEEIFKNSPTGSITAHIDAGMTLSRNMGSGSLEGGTPLPYVNAIYYGVPGAINSTGQTCSSFQNLKDSHFGDKNKNARLFAFRYMIMGDSLGDVNISGGSATCTLSDSLGRAEIEWRSEFDLHTIPGNDFLLGLTAIGGGFIQGRTSEHELGHTLGLMHGGINNTTTFAPDPAFSGHVPTEYRPEFLSTMNYTWTDGFLGNVAAATSNTLTVNNSVNPAPFQDSLGNLLNLAGTRVDILCPGGNPMCPGRGETFRIIGNTSSQLTIAGNWTTLPNATSRFRLLHDGRLPMHQGSFSENGDLIYSDWENLQLDFANYFDTLGTSLGLARFEHPDGFVDPEPPISWLEQTYGPFDRELPDISIDSPIMGATVELGNDLKVIVTATDDQGVTSVKVSFDGDGNHADETQPAIKIGGNQYETTFVGLSGFAETRILTAVAEDGVERIATTSLDILIGSSALVTTPDLLNRSQADATADLMATGLVVGTVSTASSATVPAGNVISQNPAAGANVAPGSAVDLVISSGPALVLVPDVGGKTQSDATTDVTAIGLVVGTVSTASSATVPAGNVISQTPTAGTSVATGSAVDLVISSGPTVKGDVDGDGNVDRDDLNLITAARNTPASGPNDPRDLDGDGMITALDARILVTLCTLSRCAVL